MSMKKKKVKLFKEINLWKQLDDNTVVRYRCLQLLPDGGYCVKSSHFYSYPIEVDDKQIREAEFYFLDSMFQGGLIDTTKKTYKTLEKAIEKHEKDFAFANRK